MKLKLAHNVGRDMPNPQSESFGGTPSRFDLQRSAKVTWLKFAQHFVAHPMELERQKWHQTTRRIQILLLH